MGAHPYAQQSTPGRNILSHLTSVRLKCLIVDAGHSCPCQHHSARLKLVPFSFTLVAKLPYMLLFYKRISFLQVKNKPYGVTKCLCVYSGVVGTGATLLLVGTTNSVSLLLLLCKTIVPLFPIGCHT